MIMQYLVELGPWLWVCFALLLMVLETLIPGVYFVWFGLSALVLGGALLAITALSPELAAAITWPWQLVIFACMSVVTLMVTRGFASPALTPTDLPDLNVRGAQYIGRTVTVTSAIHNGRGKVRVGDTVWTAAGEDADAGSEVRIIGVDGTVLRVERT